MTPLRAMDRRLVDASHATDTLRSSADVAPRAAQPSAPTTFLMTGADSGSHNADRLRHALCATRRGSRTVRSRATVRRCARPGPREDPNRWSRCCHVTWSAPTSRYSHARPACDATMARGAIKELCYSAQRSSRYWGGAAPQLRMGWASPTSSRSCCRAEAGRIASRAIAPPSTTGPVRPYSISRTFLRD